MAKRTGHGVGKKLSNERFVANAKPEVVQKEKDKQADYQAVWCDRSTYWWDEEVGEINTETRWWAVCFGIMKNQYLDGESVVQTPSLWILLILWLRGRQVWDKLFIKISKCFSKSEFYRYGFSMGIAETTGVEK